MGLKTILACPDMHEPFGHKKAIAKAINLAEQLKPDFIVQLGDFLDLYSFSRFPRSHNHLTPKAELELGLERCAEFWEKMRKASPKSKCVQMMGNHCERINKSILLHLPQAESLISTKDLYRFPKVETIPSEREEYIIGDILIQHGFRSKLGDHAKANMMNTIVGHSHRPGVAFFRLGPKLLWELNCGHLADDSSYALSYTRQRRISNWGIGVGYVDELGPRFISLQES